MKHTRILRFFIVLIFFLGIIGVFSIKSYAREEKTVRIGYYETDNFQEGATDKEAKSGYGYEYIQKVASYTGWHYEYVYGTWTELYKKLINGEIDMLGGVAYTKERTKSISYPDYDMLNETFYIYKDVDDKSIQCGDLESYKGKKIGVLKNDTKMVERFQKWIKKTHAEIETVYYESIEECGKDFNNKKIDGFVSADNIVSSYTGITPVEKIGKEPYYLCIAKKRKDLLNELNIALSIIDEQDARELEELKTKYSTESSISVFLSKQESEWMKKHSTITVGYINNYLPYSDTDNDGMVIGLVADIVPDLIAALPGDYSPDIVYQGYDSQEELFKVLKAGEVDFIFPVSSEAWYAEQKGYQQSSSVITSPMELVYMGNYGEDTTKTIAVNKNNLLQYYYTQTNFPDAKIIECNTITECINRVRDGKVGSTIVNAFRVNQLVGSEKKLNISPLPNVENRCFGVAFGNSELLQILNHGLNILGSNYGLNHAYQYMDILNKYTVEDFIEEHMVFLVSSIVAVLLIVILYFIRHNQKLAKIAKKEEEQKQILEEALETAQKASLARTVFLRNMSHDIRTPMNAVIGFTNLALKSENDMKKIRDYLSKILVSGNHLLAIVNEVLEISRIESNQIKLNEEPCYMLDVICEVETMIREQAEEKKQNFTVDLSKIQSPYVYCDKLQIKEILVNLLGNSVKFTPRGGKILLQILQLESDKEGIGNYEIHVKDNGRGMSKAFMEKMFEPFEREQNSTNSGVQGTGLGLPIVKNFVDLMGGTINVTSKENHGTEFIIQLSHRLASPFSTEKQEENFHVDFGKKRILLVEDNELNREIAIAILEDVQLMVEEAENGAIAVQKVKNNKPGYFDVILMDIQMPVLNGYEATKQIRGLEDKRLSQIPIIAVSANAFEEDKEESLKAGMNEHIAKPIDEEELIRVLGKVLVDE